MNSISLWFGSLDPTVQAAIITAVATVVAAMIAAICAALIGQQISKRKRLQKMLATACDDIAFLLAVEEEHCRRNREGSGESEKIRVRHSVREHGMSWSGKFTPGRVQNNSLIPDRQLIRVV